MGSGPNGLIIAKIKKTRDDQLALLQKLYKKPINFVDDNGGFGYALDWFSIRMARLG